jgi:hypothetical protein
MWEGRISGPRCSGVCGFEETGEQARRFRCGARCVARMWEGPISGPRCSGVCGFPGFGGCAGVRENCPELLYRLQLAAEREAEAEQEARAAFWRLWKTPYERVKRVRPRTKY